MRFFKDLADTLFGRFTPVAPFVQTMVDGLRDNPANYTVLIERRWVLVRQIAGELAANGVVAKFYTAGDETQATVVTDFFDRVDINYREAKLLVKATRDWLANCADAPALLRNGGWYFTRSV